jgi:hypothetical protein
MVDSIRDEGGTKRGSGYRKSVPWFIILKRERVSLFWGGGAKRAGDEGCGQYRPTCISISLMC